MNSPKALRIYRFGKGDPLTEGTQSNQTLYIRKYLAELGAISVLEEPNYFDRDYLAEFAAFYAISSRGYPNICSRLHFFSKNLNREILRRAAGGNKLSLSRLQSGYLGFVVVRPIGNARFGRTVLRWYLEALPKTPRIYPIEEYQSHVAGMTFKVDGIAWQQQDQGVGACATIAIWSMLQSSAHDKFHAIPTTPEITKAANRTASLGNLVFPSSGLSIFQILEAIKELGLSPSVIEGNVKRKGRESGFSKEKFASDCAALIRSGFPFLLLGEHRGGCHAVCVVGFRDAPADQPKRKTEVNFQDKNITIIYIHDDNIGPNVRFKISEKKEVGSKSFVTLRPEAPKIPGGITGRFPDPLVGWDEFVPNQMVVAMPSECRLTPDILNRWALETADEICGALNSALKRVKIDPVSLNFSARFLKVRDYLGTGLNEILHPDPYVLSSLRLSLTEAVIPLSLHIGIVRIAVGSDVIMDILFDTTDTEIAHPIFASVVFSPFLMTVFSVFDPNEKIYGKKVAAFR